ncbi:tetratricopeptide repeat protein [Pelagicoccus sp. SDUM812002]|uniref:tetratricopeptide repeat protein n=1 Tax=Pelagicoccus sp. SDUM812002 TaxID=3041266 RepID=UPI00280EAED4|nr:tetratricopeptide repeat protein [Pelagicoccus sp. SDUM812002]MDQ8187783.1 tetratricopeptide repeat protein [Pelagicoccus sp. SDUM812002]
MRKTKLSNRVAAAIALVSLSHPFTQAASDGVYPLTENSWSNPEFKKRFLGSYGFDLEINPKITSEESEQLQQVAEFMNSDPSEAIRILEAGLTADSSAALDYTIGSLYLQQGETDKAIETYRGAIKKFPNFFRAYQNIGFALVQQAKYDEAKPMLIEAIEIGGGNGTLFGLLGYCFLNTGDTSLSLDAYRQALLFQPDSSDWLLGKLNSLLDLQMNEEAIGMLSDLIAKRPSEANFWMMQANAYMGARDFEKALANLELVSRMGAASPASLALLGDIFLNEGLADLAVERYTDAIKSGDLPAQKLLTAAEGLAQRGSIQQSLDLVSRIESGYSSKLSPKDELALLNLKASGALAQGDSAAASKILEEIVSKDPLNGKALLLLGDLYKSKDDTENAMIQYERASKVKGFEAKALISLARLEVALKDYSSAITNLRRANALEPKAYLEDYISRLEAASKPR